MKKLRFTRYCVSMLRHCMERFIDYFFLLAMQYIQLDDHLMTKFSNKGILVSSNRVPKH